MSSIAQPSLWDEPQRPALGSTYTTIVDAHPQYPYFFLGKMKAYFDCSSPHETMFCSQVREVQALPDGKQLLIWRVIGHADEPGQRSADFEEGDEDEC